MNKTHSLMAALTMTAIILGAILLTSNAPQAQASMVNNQSEFTMFTAGVPAGDEMLFIVDKIGQKMLIYRWAGSAGGDKLDLVAGGDFGRSFTGR